MFDVLSFRFVAVLWSPAGWWWGGGGGGGLLALLCLAFSCVLSLSRVVSWVGVVLDCIDSLPSYLLWWLSFVYQSYYQHMFVSRACSYY